jgi:transcriptional regulator with XRE-family HTH domain
MNPTRFRACLVALGWSQHSLARLLHVNFSSVQRWATGAQEIPAPVAAWLETLARCHEANPPPTRASREPH